MIRTQLNLFSDKIKKGQQTKSTIIRQSSSNNLKESDPIVGYIGNNFSTSDRKYYAGMTDGDGALKEMSGPKFTFGLTLRHDHAEPILKLAEIFDLTISKLIYLIPRGKAQPTLTITISGIKAKLFLFSIYPYLLEKKEKARAILISLGCPEKYLQDERQFSFEYLAGYTDAEGRIHFKLSHQQQRRGRAKQLKTYSTYQMHYELINNDNAHLQFLKKNLIDLGFDHFRKDYIDTYKYLPAHKQIRNKPTTHILLGGAPDQLSKFYKNIEPFILIKHKKDKMLATMKYSDIITMNK
tara:strand:- start:792 stop:1679 length:888 start_codon:yes stop_codon:yes gene_type:complete